MAPPRFAPKPRQQWMDVYNSTSTGHQVGSGVSKPSTYHRSRAAKLQQQFKSNQAPLTAFLNSAKVSAPGTSAATEKGANTHIVSSPANITSETGKLSSSSSSQATHNMFVGCSIYINGSTAPQISDVELKRLLSHYGARISVTLAQKTTTHVIISDMGGGLAAGKLQKEIAGKRNNIKYVSVRWALDSMAAEKRLSETQYNVLSLHGQKQKSMTSMFSGISNKKKDVSSE